MSICPRVTFQPLMSSEPLSRDLNWPMSSGPSSNEPLTSRLVAGRAGAAVTSGRTSTRPSTAASERMGTSRVGGRREGIIPQRVGGREGEVGDVTGELDHSRIGAKTQRKQRSREAGKQSILADFATSAFA